MGFLTKQDDTIKHDLVSLVAIHSSPTNLHKISASYKTMEKADIKTLEYGMIFDTIEKMVESITPDHLQENIPIIIRSMMVGEDGIVKKEAIGMFDELVDEIRDWMLERLEDEEEDEIEEAD